VVETVVVVLVEMIGRPLLLPETPYLTKTIQTST